MVQIQVYINEGKKLLFKRGHWIDGLIF